MYLCGNSLITFIFENEELKKINLHDKEDLFPSIAVARVFNIRSEGMNETQSAISMSMEEGSFETELCTVSYNNLVGLEFTLI
jgi:hypothetical protein